MRGSYHYILKRKFFILLYIFTLAYSNAFAQALSVESFKLLENDLTANTYGTIERDQNGEIAALIKIITTETGFAFDGGMLGIVKTEQKVSELWVYVPRGIQRIKIMHPQLGQVEYFFPIPIQSARTYEMRLITGRIRTIIQDEVAAQFVIFKVTPQTAIVTIDENQYSLQADGTVSQLLPYGFHSYRIDAPGYKSESGVVEIGKERTTCEINLLSTRGTVTLECPMREADIYVNGSFMGIGSWTGQLDAAMYQVEVKREGYSTRTTSFTLQSMEEKKVTLPIPQPVYGTISVTSQPIGATVFVDSIEIGTTPLIKGEILTGHHKLELRKKDYSPVFMEVDIKEDVINSFNAEMTDVFVLTINTQPIGATITINDENKGVTPFKGKFSSGDYDINLMKMGYAPYKKKIHFDASCPDLSIVLKPKILSEKNIYFGADYQWGHLLGATINAGFYVKNLNIETGIIIPNETLLIEWGGYNEPFKTAYIIPGHIGYGFLFGNRTRITPRIGFLYYQLNKDGQADGLELKTYLISGRAGIRFEYAPLQNISFVCTPAYDIPVTMGAQAQQIDVFSDTFKQWCRGFSFNLGLELIF